VDDEGHGVLVGLVANGVRRVPHEWNHVSLRRSYATHPSDRAVERVTDVEGELAAQHEVHLAGRVPVHHRRPASGAHPDLRREQCAVAVRAGHHDRQIVRADPEALGLRSIDR